ncbi:NAD-dependent epimerase/dehydratase family protein [Jidongwangia harbinensis]|uniref:NAD-dependent epimerase/dehydratase family protein n=1 Tax=Jidongwangia harbinensis TaxID=2878561 RepID=UPI001CD9B0F5|nr:NAD-dependent epimerase/dehydratase family protein [Jidongwangia harbinensis]MCA2214939.1 NAD-dependent epimerase/dehydratase family protein [Jidongwangia harbinensis]
MRLLVLGGTGFVGRAVVTEALHRRHHVTVLNRGHRPGHASVTTLVGDRTTPDGLTALHTGTWDAVVDTWSDAPRAVLDAATLLAGRAAHYTYISSRSVYAAPDTAPLSENTPVVDGTADSTDTTDYAATKRGGELAAQHFGDRVLLARAGLILGPHEDVGRLPWWLHRLARGGPTLAPGPRDLPLQYIDARDLAAFVLDAAADHRTGPYNLVSPPGHTTMGELLDTANTVTGGHADLRWTDPDTILAAGIQPWTELPIWLPPGHEAAYLHQGDVTRALAAGLRVRPVTDTVTDTWAWLRSRPAEPPHRHTRAALGLDPATEQALLS